MSVFTGTSGNDSFTGTAAADFFDLIQGGNDTAAGLAGNDLFNMGATFTALDRIDGGDGQDTVALVGDYSAGLTFAGTTMLNVETIDLAAGDNYKLTTNDATVAAGATLTVDGTALGAGDSLTFNGIKETDGSLVLIGGAGNDVLTGGTYTGALPLTNTFDLYHGGDDTVIGGVDVTNVADFGATFTAADRVQGRGGNMTVLLDGNYTGSRAVTMDDSTLDNVTMLKLSAGHSYTLASGNALMAITVIDGSALGAGDVLRFDASAQTSSGVFDFIGGAGNDVLIGSSGGENNVGDTFDLSKGGKDTVVGSPYSDIFEFGAAFTAADQVDGGTPDQVNSVSFGDTVELDGNYSGTHAVTFGAKTMVNIENLRLAAGHSYMLTASPATVAAGKSLFVDGSALGAGNVLTFDGSAVKFGGLGFADGAGNDVLTGGEQADLFLFNGGNDTAHGGGGNDKFRLFGTLNAGDAIDGGSGFDLVELDGDYSAGVIFSSTTLRRVEELDLATGHSYRLTTADGTVSAGSGLTVDAWALVAGNDLNFDGSAETNGYFQVYLGAGKDTIRGGASDDTVDFGTDFKGNDFFDGGAGTDMVSIGKAYAASMVLSNLKNIENLDLADDNYHITTTDGMVSNGARLSVSIGGVNGGTLWFDGSAETNGSFNISGSDGDDHLRGGAKTDIIEGGDGADFLRGGGGADFLRGGNGDDTYYYGAVTDSTGKHHDTIHGFNANGSDLLVLHGDPIGDVDTKIAHGSLSDSTFDSDLSAAVNAAHLLAHHAVLFTPDAGSHAGQTFLIADANGHAGYQAGADYVIRLQTTVNIGELAASSFLTG